MAETPFEQLIQRAAQTENTPELAHFWQQQYQAILEKGLFVLNAETIRLLQLNAVDKPSTTLGDVVLKKHLTGNGLLDEAQLKETVEVSVRLLDAFLECIPFSSDAKQIVGGYRKIGLGIADLAEYVQQKNGSKMEEIDRLGAIISTSAYRSSEMLAQEKGACRNWKAINKHLRPKLFELWQNEENNIQRNGLEMSEEFTSENVQHSGYVILPRRNSNILMLPPDLEWQIWSDRDQTSPITPIDTATPSKIEQSVLPISAEIEPASEPAIFVDEEKDIPHISLQPQFQIGELVVVQTNDVPEFEKVYQVIDIHTSESGVVLYELTGGNEELEHKRWLENQLKPVELTEILHKVNNEEKKEEQKQEPKEEVKPEIKLVEEVAILSHSIILNEEGDSVAVKKDGDKVDFVGFPVRKNEIPERVLIAGLREKYNIEATIEYEVGSSVTYTNTDGPSFLHQGFLLSAKEVTHPDLGWFNLEKIDILPAYMQVILQKLQKHQKSFSAQVLEINRLQKENEALKTLQQEKPVVYLPQNGNEHTNSDVLSVLPIHSNVNSQATSSLNPVTYKSNFHLIHAMSKYALKLEQLVQTNAFGDVNVTLQYDDEGAKVVTAQGKGIVGDLQQQLDTVLGLVNFLLVKRVAPSEIASQLEKEPKGNKLPLNDLLKVIAASLKQAPENADKINGTLLGHITAEVVNEVAEAIKTGKPTQAAQPEEVKAEKPVENKEKPSEPVAPQQQPPAAPQPQQAAPAQQNGAPKPQDQNRPMFNNPFAR